jgi:hypothetical protein
VVILNKLLWFVIGLNECAKSAVFALDEYLCEVRGGADKMEGEMQMSRRAKLDKIDAEIARMEVEYELENSGVGGAVRLGAGFSGGKHSGSYLGSGMFGWVTGKKDKLDPNQNVLHFKGNVLDPALDKLRTEKFGSDSVATISVAESVNKSEYDVHANMSGTFGKLSSYEPSASWKFNVNGVLYYLFLFVDMDVQCRLMKLISGQRPSIAIIKPFVCWAGSPKKDCTTLVWSLAGQVIKLHNATDDKLTTKVK